MSVELGWLPEVEGWGELLKLAAAAPAVEGLARFRALANSRMDFVRAGKLDRALGRWLAARAGEDLGWPVVRLALLGSSTLSHLVAGLRLGGLRRGLLVEVYLGGYGMYRQELADRGSGLFAFAPDVVCFAMDAEHLAGGVEPGAAAAMRNLRGCWALAKEGLGARAVVQQTVLPRFPVLLGNNEERMAGSPAAVVAEVNGAIRAEALAAGVEVLSVDRWAAEDGLGSWFDAGLWHQAKQEVHPRAAVLWGDQLGRLVGALWGRSAKCLVLDLDNTLWGGVIGDDGLEGIALGQGSAAGEAFAGFQRYVKGLAGRGVVLAVCSKNEEANALEAFERHPEMVLRREDIACFVANWRDKAANLREIAARLNLGLDALVFVDDNPAERRLVRAELPMVWVPEMPEEPAEYARVLAGAGYFEAVALTEEDRARTELYRANAEREAERAAATDMGAFLEGLRMELQAEAFYAAGVKRVAQLMNKTNQFNLTTRRYTEADVQGMMADPEAMTLQLRLLDTHGDNGVIGVVVGYRRGDVMDLDTWLMSCRVLGRGVEDAVLNLVAERAAAWGCTRVVGEYRPTAKNGMVREHYGRLGFGLAASAEDGATRWELELDGFEARPAYMKVVKGEQWQQQAMRHERVFTAS